MIEMAESKNVRCEDCATQNCEIRGITHPMPCFDFTEFKEGWVWFLNSKKAHYVKEHRALCGRWLYLGNSYEQGKDDSPDNCAECKRRLLKIRGKQVKIKVFSSTIEGDGHGRKD
jgi:hypothetical protein